MLQLEKLLRHQLVQIACALRSAVKLTTHCKHYTITFTRTYTETIDSPLVGAACRIHRLMTCARVDNQVPLH
jgi:hypothetical protein